MDTALARRKMSANPDKISRLVKCQVCRVEMIAQAWIQFHCNRIMITVTPWTDFTRPEPKWAKESHEPRR